MSEYIEEMGNIVKVSSGISGGKTWMACRVKKSGARQRIKSKFLPERDTQERAQADLDRYAENKGWPFVEEGIPMEWDQQ